MKRVMVIGISPGTGKSTFARRLGESINIPVYHLDSYFWKPGWQEAGKDEFLEAQRRITAKEGWIIEGNYFSTFEERVPAADTLIYLEMPLTVCLYRAVKRRWQYRGRTREDMAPGCPEKLDWEFLRYILTTYRPRKERLAGQFKQLKDQYPNLEVIELKGRQAIRMYLEEARSRNHQ